MAEDNLNQRIDSVSVENITQVRNLYTDWLSKSHADGAWDEEHCILQTAKNLRDKLLEAAKRHLLKEKGRRDGKLEATATRAFLWTLESRKDDFDSLTANAGANQNRFPIANTYELGEALCQQFGGNGVIDTPEPGNPGSKLQHKCSKIRAKLRARLDQKGADSVRLQEFIALDLACCFEWRRRALEQYTQVFEDFASSLESPSPRTSARETGVAAQKAEDDYTVTCKGEEKVLRAPTALRSTLEAMIGVKVLQDDKEQPLLQHLGVTVVKRNDNEALFETPPGSEGPSALGSVEVRLADLITKLRQEKPIALLTVNKHEFNAALGSLSAWDGPSRVLKCETLMGPVYAGKFAGRPALLAQCDMGSSGLLAAQSATRLILDTFDFVQVILAVGVCFGVDRRKQKFGDIVVASTIIPYEPQRINPAGAPPAFRGDPVPAGSLLLKAFKEWSQNNEAKLTHQERGLAIHIGSVLSGEKLVDDKPFRDSLLQQWPDVVGGEMEGVGAYTACFGRPGVQVLLVKSICDFADGIKDKLWQPFAAAAAVEFCKKVLEDRSSQINLCLLKPTDPDESVPSSSPTGG